MKGKYVNIENINGTSFMVNFNLNFDIPGKEAIKEIEAYMERWHKEVNTFFDITKPYKEPTTDFDGTKTERKTWKVLWEESQARLDKMDLPWRRNNIHNYE